MSDNNEAVIGVPVGDEAAIDDPRPTRAGRVAAAGGAEPIDVETYAARYTGRTKVTRLLFIAERCGNERMQLDALRMAHDEIKKGKDTRLYREVTAKIGGRLGHRYDLDQSWVNAVDHGTEVPRKTLEKDLNGYEAYVNEEPIRIGLASLEKKKYELAAKKFLETSPELGNKYSDVIAPEDVALYGGLCALASFDRTELKNKVIDNIDFRIFLDLVPAVRELINDFYASRISSCVEYLENLKPNLLLDIHLHDHVEPLYMEIRQKAIIQYTLPFISIDLHSMADAFKTSVGGLEKELEALITENQIQAQVDSHNKILYSRRANQRNETFQRALQTSTEFEREARAMLLRANLIKHDSILKATRKR
ncbi:COP9 signalosome complex subunit 1-like isoform X2 [Canna indica]|uniref:COP9 signalosome complex subunit 1-like isoform X2 n=1 Tax=Canna indica TaxID=4628 RepID=A0AAQ3K365_9LILI|nr:COP9 signalosome complex subunit 1-like isoform X2 [Canna indica]